MEIDELAKKLHAAYDHVIRTSQDGDPWLHVARVATTHRVATGQDLEHLRQLQALMFSKAPCYGERDGWTLDRCGECHWLLRPHGLPHKCSVDLEPVQ